MSKPCLMDLRERILAYVEAGRSCRAAARVFGVSASTAVRLVEQQRVQGHVAPKLQGRIPGTAGKLAAHKAFLLNIVRAKPDTTLKELAGALAEAHGVRVQPSSLHRALRRADHSYGKGLVAQERNRADVRRRRQNWTRRPRRMRDLSHRLVFLDETSARTGLTRLRGRCPRGERLYGSAPFGRWPTQTFVAGLTGNALIAPWVIPGAMNGDAFDTCVETQLAPVLAPGTVVILDTLSTHRSPRAAATLKAKGCWFPFLPPCSPDLNPIEMAFSKLKAHLRRLKARSFERVTEALGSICDLFTPSECENYFRAAGHAPDEKQTALDNQRGQDYDPTLFCFSLRSAAAFTDQ